MPLKILIADDSMTAQKMGKEILLGAGYEVIAVSNGAAAAKKLVEKPDICILDIIMPGYTGIEVCEKVRASADMAKTPVLLTVGKMEHFDQKEVQRVAADGVIIKPFEASDLLATIQKFADMISAPKAAAAAAAHEKTAVFQAPAVEEFKDDSYAQWKSETEETTGEVPASKKAIEMSASAAAVPAFFDMPEEPAGAAPVPADSGTSRDKTVLITPPNFPAEASPAPEAVAPPTMSWDAAPAAVPFAAEDTSAFPTPFTAAQEGYGTAPAMETPVSAPPAIEVAAPQIEYTSQAPAEVNPPMLSGFQATAHESVDVPQVADPALVTGTEGFDSFKTKVGTDEPAPAPEAAKSEEDDFEARVAAAMSELEEPKAEAVAVEEVPPAAEAEPVVAAEPEVPVWERTQRITAAIEVEPEPAPAPVHEATQVMEAMPTQVMEAIVEPAPAASPYEATQVMQAVVEEAPAISHSQTVPDGMMDASLVEQMQAAVSDMPVATAPIEDTQVMQAPVVDAAPTVEVPHQDIELAKALAAAVGGDAPVAASADHPQEVHEIAHTVTQVFNRMLPDIMEEVKRELAKRNKK